MKQDGGLKSHQWKQAQWDESEAPFITAHPIGRIKSHCVDNRFGVSLLINIFLKPLYGNSLPDLTEFQNCRFVDEIISLYFSVSLSCSMLYASVGPRGCYVRALRGGTGQVRGCVCVLRGKPIPFLVEDFPPQELTKQHKTLSRVRAQAIL